MLDLLIMYVIMAGVFTFGKQAVLNSSPFFLTAVRYIPAGLIFMAGTYFFARKKFYLSSRLLPAIAGVTFFFFLMDSFRLIALRTIPSSHGALVNSLSPFIAALFANLVFKERFTLKKLIALCIGFFGVLPLILQNLLLTPVTLTCSPLTQLGGYATLLVSSLSAVVGSFFLKQLVDREKYPIFMSIGIPLFLGGVLALICSLVLEPWNPIPVTNMSVALPLIAVLLVTHNLIAQPLFGYLVKKYPVTLVTFATLITPLATAVLGRCLYGQEIGYVFIFSLITLLASFYLFYHEEQKEGLI